MLITTVIPSFNQAAFLGRTLRSVLEQAGPFEHQVLVVDGGSTDGSVDLLRQTSDERLTWTSEPDAGQSDAINKGLTRARGDVLHWLNSDDLLRPQALATVAEAFQDHADAHWLVGDCDIIDEHDRSIRRWIQRYKRRDLRRYSLGRLLRQNFISQMSVFWRRSLMDRVGLLDESLHYAMDYDLWLRFAHDSDAFVVPQALAAFRVHRHAKTQRSHSAGFAEQYSIVQRYTQDPAVLRAQRRNIGKATLAYRLLDLLGR